MKTGLPSDEWFLVQKFAFVSVDISYVDLHIVIIISHRISHLGHPYSIEINKEKKVIKKDIYEDEMKN